MKCDHCDKEATVEEVLLVGDSYVYKHMCESCASEVGLLKSGAGGRSEPTPSDSACPRCGMTFQAFRESKRLGCPACYDAFTDRLGPVLSRAHDGATHHTGKVPKRLLDAALQDRADAGPSETREAIARVLGQARERADKIERVAEQLAAAVRSERFEQAALLRDELERLRSAVQSHTHADPSPDEAG
ncbi:MAG: UvrB/UvrC motif-containing protein [Planctomycetota bacterium]